jgi:O-antigen ligase/polysaccharide polymerase Wzy-like membrane protein
VLAFDSGGSGVVAQSAGAVVAFAFLAALAALAPWPLVERSWPLAALLALAALAVWTGVSVAWSPAEGNAVNDTDRVAFYAAAFALALVAMRVPAARRIAPDALLWGIAIVALYALAGRLLPDLVEAKLGSVAGDRLDQPLTYWNAMGILTGFGVLLAAAVAATDARPLVYRAAACAAGIPCGLACYLTFSRGSWAAIAAGLAVLLLVRPHAAAALAAALSVGFAGLLALVLRAFPAALHLDEGRAAQADDGLAVALVAVALAAIAGVAFARLAGRVDAPLTGARRLRGLVAAAAVPVVLAAAIAVTFSAERTEQISKSAERVTTLKTLRGDYWSAALDTFADNPVAGAGVSSFSVEWRRRRDTPQFAYDAHSLYFETLAELGLVGGGLLAAFYATVALGVRRRWRAARDDPLLAAGAAVLAAFAVHAGLDWDWEMPAVTVVALILAAAAIQAPEREP